MKFRPHNRCPNCTGDIWFLSSITLPETNSKRPWKCMVGIRFKFPFGAFRSIFRGEVLVSGRISPNYSDWNQLNTWLDVEVAIVKKHIYIYSCCLAGTERVFWALALDYVYFALLRFFLKINKTLSMQAIQKPSTHPCCDLASSFPATNHSFLSVLPQTKCIPKLLMHLPRWQVFSHWCFQK